MAITQYWVGSIPANPIAISVRDENGAEVNLTGYTDYEVLLLGSDNEEIDIDGYSLVTAQADTGRFLFRWPTDRSVFDNHGDYLLQMEFSSPTAKDFTTEHSIRVRRLGGTK